MPDTVQKALNIALVAAAVDHEERLSFQETRGLGKEIFAVGGNRENTAIMHNKYSRGKS